MKESMIKKQMKIFTTTLLNLAIIAISISLFACSIDSVGVTDSGEADYKNQLKTPIGDNATSSYTYNVDKYSFTKAPQNKSITVEKFVFAEKVPFSRGIYNINKNTSYDYPYSQHKGLKRLNSAIDKKYVAPSANAGPYRLDIDYFNINLATWGNATLNTVITGGGYTQEFDYSGLTSRETFSSKTGVAPTVNITATFSDQSLVETIWNKDYPIDLCVKGTPSGSYMLFSIKFENDSKPLIPSIKAAMDVVCVSPR